MRKNTKVTSEQVAGLAAVVVKFSKEQIAKGNVDFMVHTIHEKVNDYAHVVGLKEGTANNYGQRIIHTIKEAYGIPLPQKRLNPLPDKHAEVVKDVLKSLKVL